MSKLPLYKQIVHDLKSKIIAKELAPNEQVPTELELAKLYKVSRITSKRALTELEYEKLIYRIRGKGSFVSDNQIAMLENVHQSNTILFILPFVNNPDLGSYAQGMMRFLNEKPYQLHIQPDTILNEITIDTLLNQYSGIIVYPSSSNSHIDLLYTLYLNRFPILVLDKQLDGIPLSSVTADNFQGGYDATNHLITLGHKKIIFLAMHKIVHSSSIRNRYLGYLKALYENGLSFNMNYLFPIEEDEASLIIIFQELISVLQANNITGIVTENDITAIRFMNLLHKEGFNVPADFAIIGFDNLQASSLVTPSLSTISQDFEQIGYLAAKQIISHIENNDYAPQNITVPIELIVRESTNQYKENTPSCRNPEV